MSSAFQEESSKAEKQSYLGNLAKKLGICHVLLKESVTRGPAVSLLRP